MSNVIPIEKFLRKKILKSHNLTENDVFPEEIHDLFFAINLAMSTDIPPEVDNDVK